MHQNAIVPLATAHHDVEADTRERRALLAEARWEVRRQHAAEAVRSIKIRRQHGAAVVEDLTT